jgi:hypothetical protein
MMEMGKQTASKSPYTTYTGVAAEDLQDESVVLKVICPELAPHSTFGSVGAGITTGSVNLQDRDGRKITSGVTLTNHIVATWEGSSNSRYAPLVRKGESVEIYRIGDQDKFLWRATGRGRDYRTTDRHYIEIAASDPSKPGASKSDDNTYTAYVDSQNKKVGFKTSKANGEVAAFSMEADLAEGTFHITDNGTEPGTRLFIDTGAKSGIPAFQINLVSGATIKLQDKDAFFKIPGKMSIDVGDRLIFNAPLTIFNIAQKGTVIINAANIAINAAKDFVATAKGVIGWNAASVKVSGILIALGIRSANVVKGGLGGEYKAASIRQPEESPVTEASNSPDTSMIDPPYRT